MKIILFLLIIPNVSLANNISSIIKPNIVYCNKLLIQYSKNFNKGNKKLANKYINLIKVKCIK